MRTTADLFQKQLHVYTITHAIEDGNVLRFHIDYFKPEGKNPPKPDEAIAKQSVIESILAKHDSSTNQRRFNAILATASINDAIEYHALFKTMQAEKQSPRQGRTSQLRKPPRIPSISSLSCSPLLLSIMTTSWD